jgi:phosphomannomutase/phosphoglucomutase
MVLDILGESNMAEYKVDKSIPASIFRAYDIRGIVDKTLTVDGVYSIGLSIGSEALEKGQTKVAIGRDGRLSGKKFIQAMSAGLRDAGCDVINIGEVTSPILYYATHVLDTKSGVMITGSHNPPDYNGIKIVIDGKTYCEQAIQDLYQRIQKNNFKQGQGTEKEVDLLEQYITRIVTDIKLAKPLRVVVDCGNGVGGKIAPKLFRQLGCEVIELFCEVDGTFPNHHPDPSIPENMQDLIKTVREQKADIGLAFDGDADRLGVVTNKGEMIWPDRQIILFAKDILSRNPGAPIIFDVKCTTHLAKEIEKSGGKPLMIQTGHAILKSRLQEIKGPFAGEFSGHIFFKERWYGFDDGIYAGARLLEIIAKDGRSSSEIFDEIPNSLNTPELKIQVTDENKYTIMQGFIAQAKFPGGKITTIDGIRVDYPDGFGLLRASNTTPMLITRFEGENKPALEKIQKLFHDELMVFDKTLKLPF